MDVEIIVKSNFVKEKEAAVEALNVITVLNVIKS